MSSDDWISLAGAIASFAAAAATFGLLYVGRKTLIAQLDQIEEQTRITNNQALVGYLSEYTKRYQEIILNLPETINEPDFDLAGHPERPKTMRYLRAYFDLCYEEWFLSTNEYLHSDLWDIWRDGMATAMSKTAFRDSWKIVKSDSKYDDNFTSFLTDLTSN